MKNWHGILKINDIQHLSKEGKVLWREENIYNTFQQLGEAYLLDILFTGAEALPSFYYVGLDNRSSILFADTMDDIIDEPSVNGYIRQPVSSTGQFTVALSGSHYAATGPVVNFVASGGSWGPVSKIFLSNKIDETGVLIGSSTLSQSRTVADGEIISMSISMAFKGG